MNERIQEEKARIVLAIGLLCRKPPLRSSTDRSK